MRSCTRRLICRPHEYAYFGSKLVTNLRPDLHRQKISWALRMAGKGKKQNTQKSCSRPTTTSRCKICHGTPTSCSVGEAVNMKPGVGWHSVAGNVHLMIDSTLCLIDRRSALEPWEQSHGGGRGRAGWAGWHHIALWDARQRRHAGRKLPAQRQKTLDPVRKCAKAQIAARSAENKSLVCYWALGLGDGGGGGVAFAFLPFQPSPRGGRGPEPLPGGGPVSRKPQTLIFAAA